MRKVLFFYLMAFLPIWSCFAQVDFSPKYVGDMHLGYGSTSITNGMDTYQQRGSVGTIQGVKLGKWMQVGLGVDVNFMTHYFPNKGIYASMSGLRMYMNEYIDLRGYYPINDNFRLYVDLGLGAGHGVLHMDTKNAQFFCQFGTGLQYKLLDWSFGLHNNGTGNGSTTFFTKIGICFNNN